MLGGSAVEGGLALAGSASFPASGGEATGGDDATHHGSSAGAVGVALPVTATTGVLEGTLGANVTHQGTSVAAAIVPPAASAAAHCGQATISPLRLTWLAGNGVWQWGQAVALCMGVRLVEKV
jgi:hypothetical protein